MYLTISHWQNLNMIHIASITPELHQLRYKSPLVASQGPHSSSYYATHYQLIVGPLTNTLVLKLFKCNNGRGTSILAARFT